MGRQTFGPIPQVVERGGEQHQQGHALFDRVRILVQAQRGGQRGQRELVDAQGAGQRMLVDLVDAGAFADDDAALGPAEQLVAAEQHDVGAATDAVLGARFVA